MGTDSMTLGPGSLFINDELIGTMNKGECVYDFEDELPWYGTFKNDPVEIELEPIDIPKLLKELTDELSKPEPFYMEFDGVRYEQIRKHKKKRVNKKWAKRYGYREVPCRYRMENAYIRQETFNDFNVVADPPKIICSNLYGRFNNY